MKKMNVLLTAVLMFSAATGFASSGVRKNLDKVIDQAIQNNKIVGAVVVVAQNGKIIYQRAAGLNDREAKIKMKIDMIFRLASMTKPVISAATLFLVQQGKIKLTDPVSQWIPDFKPTLSDGSSPVITIENLLTHTAGLNYGFFEKEDGPYHKLAVSDGMDQSGLTLEENVRRIAQAPLLSKPGTQWHYSLATDVLGLVLEKATGKSLSEVIAMNVTMPLKMMDTGFSVKDPARLATPYANENPKPVKMSEPQKILFGESSIVYSPSRALDLHAYASGGAGMVGTAQDYLLFLEALRKGTLLSESSQDLIMKNQLQDMDVPGAGPGWGWSLGFAVLKNPVLAKSPQKTGTVQWGGAYGHTWWVDPQSKLTVIILTNTALEGMSGAFPTDIRNSLYSSLSH